MSTISKRSFARGYSLILHSCITYIVYTTIAGAGLNTIVPFFCAKTGLQEALVTSINTVGGILACIAVFFITKLIAKKGPRIVTVVSFILMGFMMFFLAYGGSLLIYVIFAIATQVASHGYCFASTSTLITNWYPRTKGWVMGWTTTGLLIATPTGVAFISAALPSIGFTATMNIIGVFLIAFGILSWFWIRNTPEECGLLPDNKPITEEDRYLLEPLPANQAWKSSEILLKKSTFLIILSMGLAALCSTGIALITIPVMIELGFTRMEAVGIHTITGLLSCVGSVFLGWTDTKFGTKKSLLIVLAAYIIGFFGTFYCKSVPGVIAFVVIASIFSGGYQNLFASLVGTMYGRNGFACAWGVINTGASLLRALVFLCIGIAIQTMGGYKGVTLLFGIACIISVILFIPADCAYQEPRQK